MHTITTFPFKVKAWEADFKGKLKPGSLFNFLQEAASAQASQLGFGYEQMLHMGTYWVLARLHLKIDRWPNMDEEVFVTTWPKTFFQLYALRDFEISDSQNQCIGRATSAWLVLDSKTLRPKRPESVEFTYDRLESKNAIAEPPDRIEFIGEGEFIGSRTAVYTDIDINQHVNNSRYIDWAFDAVDPEYLKRHLLREIQVNYLQQTRIGQSLDFYKHVLRGEEVFGITAGPKESSKKTVTFQLAFTPV